ncbi:hypothetical protein CHS0354_000651 [Potamilus streckersoni]|uniref:DUF262 domain-containing protein n=1 Tax=Potamilus streckersoni TaxID=2493646 RepID=A0AAE0T759_9BIVA|nr:hypothetical protein CHS0354_000651 [Potamilus streckersoni]
MKGIQGTSNKTYRQLMGNGLRYEIPKFQRDYTWEIEQWDDLWQDIQALLSDNDSEHYMGYLVLQTSNNKEFQVIDGQQRLTTMSLLILATLSCLNELIEMGNESEKNLKRKDSLLNSYIGYIDPVTLISNNKLKLNRNGDDYYKHHLVLLKDLPLKNTNASEKHLRECFKWYYDRIKKTYENGERLAGFIENIVDKLFFTVIEVTDQVNAFKVFETLNARGVQLSSSDLLKNHLFSIVDETKPHISEIEELENLWNKIVGKLGEEKFEDYLRYYWNSYNKSVGKKDLFKTMKSIIKSKKQVFDLIRDLNDATDVYLAIQNPEDRFWKDEPEIRKSLQELKLFRIKQTYSLFLSAFRKLEIDAFRKLVEICSVISFRYNVIGGLNPKNQEAVYNAVALKIAEMKNFAVKDFQSVYVRDENFENDFSTKEFKSITHNLKIAKYVFSKIERYLHHNDIDIESDLFSIEHILPESADATWGGFTDEEINRSMDRIGNLTLLEKKLNREAGQKTYSEKMTFFQKSNCKLTKSIPEEFNAWNEDKIAARQRELAKHAKSIWKIQELVNG